MNLLKALVLTVCGANAHAAVVTSGNFQTGATTPTLGFSQAFNITVSTAGNFIGIAFDEWVVSDGSNTSVLDNPAAVFSYRINNGSTQTVPVASLYDNRAANVAALTPNDGYLLVSEYPAVAVGDIVTVNAQSFSFGSNAAFNSNLPSLFTGNVILVAAGAAALSAPTPVPETASHVFAAISLAVLLGIRRRGEVDRGDR